MKCDFDFVNEKLQLRPSPGKGRGYFLSAPAAKGELLLVSRAIVSVLSGQHGGNELKRIEKQLRAHQGTFPAEHMRAYDELFVGPDHRRDLEQKFNFNAFRAHPRLDVLYNPQTSVADPDVGLYTFLSFFNHSCVPNCTKYFVNEQAFVIANENLPADVELTVNYAANEQNYFNLAGRSKQLQNYFPKCLCELCVYQSTDEYVALQLKLDAHLKLARSPEKVEREIVQEKFKEFLSLQDEVLAKHNPLLVLDGEMEAANYYFERLYSQKPAELQRLIEIVAYGFSKELKPFLKPESYFVLRKLWCLKQCAMDQTAFLEEFKAYERDRFGADGHVQTRYGKWLVKWTK